MRKRTNDKVKAEQPKIIYQATYRDIYWEETDTMRQMVDKMWDALNREQKRQLKKVFEKNKKVI